MTKPIGKWDKCEDCGHSEALNHKRSWGTTTCDSCPDCKGCNSDSGWGTKAKNKKAKRTTICLTCGKKLYRDGYAFSHFKPRNK